MIKTLEEMIISSFLYDLGKYYITFYSEMELGKINF